MADSTDTNPTQPSNLKNKMKIQTKTLQIISLSDITDLIGDDCLESISDRWTFGDCEHSLVTAENLVSQLLTRDQTIIREQLPPDIQNLFVDLES